jgi:hypothetical protein
MWRAGLIALLASAALLSGGCGGGHGRTDSASSALAPPAPPAPRGPAVGLTEDNANLLWPPGSASAGGDERFQAARRALDGLHPSYVRLLIDWAALQPAPGRPPALQAPSSGCARSVGPCAAYAGIRAELTAIAARQRAARTEGNPEPQVVLEVFGTPPWAARTASGCELAQTRAFSRPLSDTALGSYKALIGSLLELGRSEGVALTWWSPWNEPNDPVFISPQRATCEVTSPPLSAAIYAQLASAMAEELAAAGGAQQHHLLLGELSAYQRDSPHQTSIASFIAALPAPLICLSATWSIHAYAARGASAPAVDPVMAFEAALDARGACGREARIWITEAGAGAPHPGDRRPSGDADERAGCEALAEQLDGWTQDPRVEAILQYSFREDPAFPVGLVSADMSHIYPAYRVWVSYARARARGSTPPVPGSVCA